MERLTGHLGKYVHIRACSSVYLNQERKTAPASNVVVRLTAIEDILGDEYDLDRLRDMIKAQDEGRVVVLDTPRKPLVWGDDEHDTCLCPDCGEDLMGIPYGERMILQCPACGQYLDGTKIITRAEAEAAIGGGGDG